MAVSTLARDDFRNTRRSYVVVGVVGVFAALVALVFLAEMSIYDDAYRALWDVSALVAFALPLFVAPLTYLAVAGDRESGTIRFVLGLPNRRSDYLAAKYVSRASVAVAATVIGVVLGFVVAASTFENGADLWRFAVFGGISALYAIAIASTFLAISATVASRARAMFGVLAAYFVLVPFWTGFMPVLSVQALVEGIADLLGVTLSAATTDLIVVLSPTNAYFQTTEWVYAGVMDQYPEFAVFGQSETLLAEPWFALLVLFAWMVVPLAVAYWRFGEADLA